jgi:hypothetical protein
MLSTLEADRLASVTALDRWAVNRALAAWAALDLGNLQGSFVSTVLPGVLAALVKAQETAADLGGQYVDAVAEDPGPQIVARSFAGVAADGRPLPGLVSQPLIDTYKALSAGMPPARALRFGADQLDSVITTEIHDTARSAEQVAITSNRHLAGYRRSVESGACGRCVILAGRTYRWSAGFLRHPRCRCHNTPITDLTEEPQDPREQFDAMTRAEQDHSFTVAGAEAIRLGADPARVVNARAGMATVKVYGQNVQATTVLAGGKKAPVRLMPASILKLADGDRVEAERLLRLHQFIK